MVRMKLLGVAGLLVALAVGCGKEDAPPAAAQADAAKPAVQKDDGPDAEDDHSGWWCKRHGIPEEECSLCQPKVFKKLKAKGDICEKHPDRAKSQCFICDPTLKEKYAARYRAKEGKEPPPVNADQGGVKK